MRFILGVALGLMLGAYFCLHAPQAKEKAQRVESMVVAAYDRL